MNLSTSEKRVLNINTVRNSYFIDSPVKTCNKTLLEFT